VLAAAMLMVVMSVLIFRFARKRLFLPVGWLWFLGMLVPVIGLVQVGGQAMADRYAYLPAIGVFIAVVWGAAEISARNNALKIFLRGVVACALLSCLCLTRRQSGYWMNTEKLFTHNAAVVGETYIGSLAMGTYHLQHGQVDLAIAELQHGMDVDRSLEIQMNLGAALAMRGNYADAIRNFREVLALEPHREDVHCNLANALMLTRQPDEALREYETALRLNPNYFQAQKNIGFALAGRGQTNEAVLHLQVALRLMPDHPEVLRKLRELGALKP
jgi:tetratricopeptide (TPR) repeat protein